MQSTLYDRNGQRVALGRQLGRGGEGAVFEVPQNPQVVAKLYHAAVPSAKQAKLSAMSQSVSAGLMQAAAWPIGTLHERPGGSVTGILMPRIVGYEEVHKLYSPAHRKLSFPAADWAFLVHAARNVACAVEAVHHSGYVVGDINQGNVLVATNARVVLIDCDSFQISQNGTVWRCEVGVAHFTPPELHGCAFAQVTRTQNHDRFGLAVLVFHLLFMGRHPFAGRCVAKTDMPIERAIKEYRFAFSQTAAARQMAPPPHALRLFHASQPIASLFERAFGPSGVTEGRPDAGVWRAALDELEGSLRGCGRYPGHKYSKVVPVCPWCDIESGGGPDFFISVTIMQSGGSKGFDLAIVWSGISAIARPDITVSAPPLPSARGTPVGVGVKVGGIVGWLCCIATIAAFVAATFGVSGYYVLGAAAGWIVSWGVSGYFRSKRGRRSAVKASERRLREAIEKWESEGSKLGAMFDGVVVSLKRRKDEHMRLPAEHAAERTALEKSREVAQREAWLESRFIEGARISGIGPGLKATLASYGVETAADVSLKAMQGIQGFGPTRITTLLGWRADVERAFRFDSNRGVEPAAIRALEVKYAQKRRAIETELSQGKNRLVQVVNSAAEMRRNAEAELSAVTGLLALARADAAELW